MSNLKEIRKRLILICFRVYLSKGWLGLLKRKLGTSIFWGSKLKNNDFLCFLSLNFGYKTLFSTYLGPIHLLIRYE